VGVLEFGRWHSCAASNYNHQERRPGLNSVPRRRRRWPNENRPSGRNRRGKKMTWPPLTTKKTTATASPTASRRMSYQRLRRPAVRHGLGATAGSGRPIVRCTPAAPPTEGWSAADERPAEVEPELLQQREGGLARGASGAVRSGGALVLGRVWPRRGRPRRPARSSPSSGCARRGRTRRGRAARPLGRGCGRQSGCS